jgi:hypothetical protein
MIALGGEVYHSVVVLWPYRVLSVVSVHRMQTGLSSEAAKISPAPILFRNFKTFNLCGNLFKGNVGRIIYVSTHTHTHTYIRKYAYIYVIHIYIHNTYNHAYVYILNTSVERVAWLLCRVPASNLGLDNVYSA